MCFHSSIIVPWIYHEVQFFLRMGNTAAISSKSCCAENYTYSSRAPRSTSPQSDYETPTHGEALRNKFANDDRKFSIHRRVDQTTDHSFASSDTKTKTTEMDRLGQATFNNGGSSATSEGFNMYCGIDFIRNGRLSKGMTFSIAERQKLGILGLIPPSVKTDEEEVARVRANVDRLENDLNKYVYLARLQGTNERLFYRLLSEDIANYMRIVYTPTVGLACEKFGMIYENSVRGLFITIHDKGHVYEVLRNWPETDIRAIVVTDGERVLGSGDLGANGMGIPIGKLILYTAVAGIKPSQCLPVTLDVGCNTENILNNPFYIGMRHKRVTGQDYDDFVGEFMNACVRRFGRNVLIQFEDFSNANSFKLLDKYRDSYCVFNDDIQGTASVVLAGLLTALEYTKNKLSDHKIMFQGAGQAALGIANLCVSAMRIIDGTPTQQAQDRIYLVDSKGLVVENRPEDGVTDRKKVFAKDMPPVRTLTDAVAKIKPSILIGLSSVKGAFSEEILRRMASFNNRPVVFALSNPTSNAECTAEAAYRYTDGKALFGSGSPFDPVMIDGKRFEPGLANDAYVFPGVALGVICGEIRTIDDEIFLIAALALRAMMNDDDFKKGRLYPPLQDLKRCSLRIAKAVMLESYEKGVASKYPQTEDIETFIKNQTYNTQESVLPPVYDYAMKSIY